LQTVLLKIAGLANRGKIIGPAHLPVGSAPSRSSSTRESCSGDQEWKILAIAG
jgi:hypothetical protein